MSPSRNRSCANTKTSLSLTSLRGAGPNPAPLRFLGLAAIDAGREQTPALERVVADVVGARVARPVSLADALELRLHRVEGAPHRVAERGGAAGAARVSPPSPARHGTGGVTPYAVTGLGIASAIGIGREAFVQALLAGTRAAEGQAPDTFDPSAYLKLPAERARVAEVRGFDATRYLGDKGLRSLDRLTKLLVVAARLALHYARLKRDGAWATTPTGEPAGPAAEIQHGLFFTVELHL